MLASEMRNVSSSARNENEGFQKQWNKMEETIREYARNGKNACPMVYGSYNEQLIEKLKENGFMVMRKMELFSYIPYGAVNCMQQWVVW